MRSLRTGADARNRLSRADTGLYTARLNARDRILKLLARHPRAPQTLEGIATALSLSRETVFTVVRGGLDSGIIVRPEPRRVALSPAGFAHVAKNLGGKG